MPYLFGGLAAMLGLIAFALLILACSYWHLSGYFNGRHGSGTGSSELDLEAGEATEAEQAIARGGVFEEKVVVIMAGEKGPRFLATPMSSSRSSSVEESSSSSFSCGDEKAGKPEMMSEDLKGGRSLQPENNTHGHPDNNVAGIRPDRDEQGGSGQ